MADYTPVYELWSHTVGVGLRAGDDSPEGVERYLRRNPDSCFVAELDGKIVGAILAGHDGRRGYLYHLTVAQAARRRGIGSALVSAALEALAREGIRKVALVAFGTNASGNAFWERMGFTVRGDLVYRDKVTLLQNTAGPDGSSPV